MEKRDRALAQSTSRNNELQRSYDALARELTAVREALQSSISSVESKDHTIASLTEELEEWRGAGASKDKRVAVTLKQVEKLRQELSISASRLADLEHRYDDQSRELTGVRDELRKSTSSIESKDRDITSLAAEVKGWRDAGTNENTQVAISQEKGQGARRKALRLHFSTRRPPAPLRRPVS